MDPYTHSFRSKDVAILNLSKCNIYLILIILIHHPEQPYSDSHHCASCRFGVSGETLSKVTFSCCVRRLQGILGDFSSTCFIGFLSCAACFLFVFLSFFSSLAQSVNLGSK